MKNILVAIALAVTFITVQAQAAAFLKPTPHFTFKRKQIWTKPKSLVCKK